MKKALLIAALSFTVSPFAFAEQHASEHGDAHTPAAPVAAVVEVVVPETPKKAHHGGDWGYTGSKAAHKWGDLDAQYVACKEGVAQSPININAFVQEALPPLSASYAPTPLEVVNTGHSVQVNYAPGSGFRAENKNFQLLHFHFHTPSEHYIDGAPYPMEAHFVHQAEDGTLGVIGVMMKVGAHNPVIEGIWQNAPGAGDTKRVETVELSAADLMPAEKGYYRYEGSLTTPPCSEGVQWYVMQQPIEISQAQLVAFQSVFPVNARPVQVIGDRVVKGN